MSPLVVRISIDVEIIDGVESSSNVALARLQPVAEAVLVNLLVRHLIVISAMFAIFLSLFSLRISFNRKISHTSEPLRRSQCRSGDS